MTPTHVCPLLTTTATPKSSESMEDHLVTLREGAQNESDRSMLLTLDAAASSSVDAPPDVAFASCHPRCKSESFAAHDWRKTESEAITKLKVSVSCRVRRLLDNEDYAKLLDKYVALLEENELLKKSNT